MTNSNATKLVSDGKCYFTQGFFSSAGSCCSSDSVLKKNVETIPDASSKLSRLRGVTFDWRREKYPELKLPGEKQVGIIAQELEQEFPELVETDHRGYKSVNYAKLSAVLLQGFNEQQKRIEMLEKRLIALEGRAAR